jgi:hypothetical protein
MSKKEIDKEDNKRFNIFENLVYDDRKKKQLREVLKKYDRTLEDYGYLWKDKKFL